MRVEKRLKMIGRQASRQARKVQITHDEEEENIRTNVK